MYVTKSSNGDAGLSRHLQVKQGLTMQWRETPKTIAPEVGKSISWVYKAVKSGLLPFRRVGGSLRFNKEEVWAHLANQRPKKRGRPRKGTGDVAS